VSGILAGLVVITPAAGVVLPLGALTLGALSSIVCFYALKLKGILGYDDSLDCFGIHGVGSGLGVLLLSFFIRDSWLAKAAASRPGWSVWDQLGVQLTGMAATIALAAVATIIICYVVEKTVGFRIDEQSEIMGLDTSLHGERGYGMIHGEG
jgi:Amt family ammonium transporter